jgi:pimeloyl-ACP methyl ester carboxylesterase
VTARERRFQLSGLTLAGVEWGSASGRPLLATHGWLDNAGSFDLLAPLLDGCQVVALDLAGHGSSDFRSADASYNIWQDVGDLLEVVDQLAWPRLSLLGHSRGAAIAMLFAATFPERVGKLVLLEGGLPLVGSADDAPQNLAQALVDRRGLLGKRGRIFTDRETAIAERAEGFSRVSRGAAAMLARRSLREVSGGFQWHADQRLKGASELKLTAEHVRAFVERVRAPVLMILAEHSPFRGWPIYERMIGRFAAIEVVRLPGGHHFHLEGTEREIANRINRFLADD